MEGDTGHYIMQRPYYIVPTIDSSDITSDIKSNNRYVLAPISQPVKTLSDYRDTLQISSLLSTSDEAYIKTDVQNMTTYEKEDSDEEGSFQVGVSVTEQVVFRLCQPSGRSYRSAGIRRQYGSGAGSAGLDV